MVCNVGQNVLSSDMSAFWDMALGRWNCEVVVVVSVCWWEEGEMMDGGQGLVDWWAHGVEWSGVYGRG